MKKLFIGALMVMLIFGLVGCGGGGGGEPANATPKELTEIASWTGSGIKSTETFITTDKEFRIEWTTTNEAFPGAGILQIFVYDENGNMVNLAANVTGAKEDVSYVRTKPGRYYLEINSANVNWAVVVKEMR